jgi:hypothetical protein
MTMLCDYLVAERELLKTYDGLENVYRKIVLAQKFILTKDFSIAADGLVDNLPELEKIVPYCRLPFPLMWVEWLHDDRPHWDVTGPYTARPIDKSRHQSAPSRIAFLLEQRGDNPTKWKAHLFWSLKELPEGGVSIYNGSFAALGMDATKGLDYISEFLHADFGMKLVSSLSMKEAEKIAEYALEDWGGEMRFMIALLGLLNARNVVETETVNKDKHNVKRMKQGKLPLFSHKLLKIRPQIYVHDARNMAASQNRDMRFHFVTGHFKHRKSGLFWWSMHARGSVKQGVIDKDYVV